MEKYQKGALTFADQLQQLQERGLQVAEPAGATLYLQRVGYYRLMGYLFPFRVPHSDDYQAGATFEAAVGFYEFDRALRLLVLEAIGHIEVAVRTAVTYEVGHAHGAFGHCYDVNFAFDPAWHTAWLAGVDEEVGRAREMFIDHYRRKYDDPPFPRVPIWMATEVISLGTLSHFYKGLKTAERKAVAAHFGLRAPVLESWIHAISVVRNICAHHGRLWNRVLGVQPKRPENGQWQYMASLYPGDRVYFMLLVLRAMLANSAADADAWRDRVENHLRPLLADADNLQRLGAPRNWDTHPLWR